MYSRTILVIALCAALLMMGNEKQLSCVPTPGQTLQFYQRILADSPLGQFFPEGAASALKTDDAIVTYVVSSHFPQTGSADGVLVQLDEEGNETNRVTFGGDALDTGQAVAVAENGEVVVAGNTRSFDAQFYDAILLRINPGDNTTLWQHLYGGPSVDQVWDLAPAPDGGWILAGQTSSFGAGGFDIYLVKTAEDGTFEWQQTFGGTGDDIGHAVQSLAGGGYVVAGSFAGDDSEDMFLVRADADGNVVWEQTFGSADADETANDIVESADGSLVAVGERVSDGGVREALVLRADADGNLIWEQGFGGTTSHMAAGIVGAPDGTFVVAGEGNSDMYLLHIDLDGNPLTTRYYGGTGADEATHIHRTPDGGYVLVGTTRSFGVADYSGYVVKTDADFNTTSGPQ